MFPEAPLSPKDLAASSSSDAPVLGAFASFVGRRFSIADLRETDAYYDEDEALVARIRAFEVPLLIGATLSIRSSGELEPALRTLLTKSLRSIDFDWTHATASDGPFLKYCILHTSIAAPPDDGMPMALEIYGRLERVDGADMESEAGRAWFDNHQKDYRRADGLVRLEGAFDIEVRSATYSNIRFPGIGVPLYM